MNYHINTILVWDSFKKGCECPLCLIENEIDRQLVYEYLNEAVMEDRCRAETNRLGFCRGHFETLYRGDNKLGVALQTDTRMKKLAGILRVPGSIKEAKKVSEAIEKELSTCVICGMLEGYMDTYCKTVAKMYSEDGEFCALFKNGKGFCLEHYAKLLTAGCGKNEYLKDLGVIEARNFERLEKELEFFEGKFDYRNADKPWGTCEDALIRSINKIHGNTVK